MGMPIGEWRKPWSQTETMRAVLYRTERTGEHGVPWGMPMSIGDVGEE